MAVRIAAVTVRISPMEKMPVRPRSRRLRLWTPASLVGIGGFLALSTGCELVAGIQDLGLTGAPEGGAGGAADEASYYGSNDDATTVPPGDARSSTPGNTAGDAGSVASDATVDGEAEGAPGNGGDSPLPMADATTPTEASGGGGTDEGGGSVPDAGGGPVPDAGPLVLALVDDMEGTNPSAGWLDGPLVTGTWFTFDDGTDGGILTPPPNASAAPIVALLSPTHVTYNGVVSAHAAHVTANSGFTSYGDGMGFNLNVVLGAPGPFNGAAYRGFVFWARALGSGALGTRFNVMDVNTTAPGSGGVCDGGACNGFFGFDFGKGNMPALTSSWQMYVVYFADLTRPVWATDDPGLAFDKTQMIGCQFQLAEGTAADLWVDDVYFIKN
jgi:hypothetical protein